MATIKYLLRSSANPAKIYVRVRNGTSLDLKVPTNLYIDPKEWVIKSGLPKNTKINQSLTQDLKLLYSSILKHLNTKNTSPVTANELIEIINPSKNRKSESSIPTSLISYYQYYIDKLTEQLTLKCLNQILTHPVRARHLINQRDRLLKVISGGKVPSFIKYIHAAIVIRLAMVQATFPASRAKWIISRH